MTGLIGPSRVPFGDDPGSDTGLASGSGTPTLDEHGHDLTDLARRGRIDPVVGRVGQIEQIIEVLCRRTKNNPLLVGEAGVGKTAIVEGFARRVAEGDVPDALVGRRVIQLDLSGSRPATSRSA